MKKIVIIAAGIIAAVVVVVIAVSLIIREKDRTVVPLSPAEEYEQEWSEQY